MTARACLISCGLLLSGSAAAQAVPMDAIRCTGAMKQGGLVLCQAPAGESLNIISDGKLVGEVPVNPSGWATIGLKRNAPSEITLTTARPDVIPATLPIAKREDAYRQITGLDCDKVDARTPEQKAHAARSWVKKQDAFDSFADGPGALGGFIRPSSGPPSSPFGPVRKYIGIGKDGEPCEKTSVHQGYDIAVPVGTEIVAPAAGTVTLGDPDLYYEGGTVFLDHGDGLVSVFMHMSAVDVSPGQKVEPGDRLGASGNTGRTTGPHLHWAVKWRNPASDDRSGDFYIDPALLLDLDPVS